MHEQQQPPLPHEYAGYRGEEILAVCGRGNGRSTAISRALEDLGYDRVQAIGVGNGSFTTVTEMLKTLQEKKIIICASTDVETDLRHLPIRYPGRLDLSDKIIINLGMSEEDHKILSASRELRHLAKKAQAIKDRLRVQLEALGFKRN